MLRVLGVIAFALPCSQVADASTVTYTSLAAYTTALGYTPAIAETFTGNKIDGTAISGITGAQSLAHNRLQQVAGTATGDQSTTLDFSTPVTSFSATIGSLATREKADVSINGVMVSQILGGTSFFALISTTAFASITFADATIGSSGRNTQFNIDNIRVTPVPVPASFPLMLIGMGAISLFARRRRGPSESCI